MKNKLYNGKTYSSKKHPMLEYIFFEKNANKDTSILSITFTLDDISKAYRAIGIDEPASISNTILDLTRKKKDISARLPESIYSLGYDLRKKTGITQNGKSYAGEFLFVGVGNQINSWLEWPTNFFQEITISSDNLPNGIEEFLRNDEGALFSVMDYCDVLSIVINKKPESIKRVQHPLKWQPNEIDGFYFSQDGENIYIYPVEAKALTTDDDINLEQMAGGLETIYQKFLSKKIHICPLAVKMIPNGILLGEFNSIDVLNNTIAELKLERCHKINFNPIISSWI